VSALGVALPPVATVARGVVAAGVAGPAVVARAVGDALSSLPPHAISADATAAHRTVTVPSLNSRFTKISSSDARFPSGLLRR